MSQGLKRRKTRMYRVNMDELRVKYIYMGGGGLLYLETTALGTYTTIHIALNMMAKT